MHECVTVVWWTKLAWAMKRTHNQDSQVNINHKHPLIQTFKETHGLAI